MTGSVAEAAGAGALLWQPGADEVRKSRMARYMRWVNSEFNLSMRDYQSLWQWSTQELSDFWWSIWPHFDAVGDGDTRRVLEDEVMPGAKWFPDVRLNYAENALRGDDGQTVVTALSQTRDDISLSRGELREQVARAAAGLRRLGVGPGDRVAAYLPNIPEALVAMLATTSIGAIWAVCAPELGSRSVIDRLQQLDPKALITVDGYGYGAKAVDRRGEVADIIAALPTLAHVVRIPYMDAAAPQEEGVAWAELLSVLEPLSFERVSFDHPLWVLFSSGTTGLPKAIVHSHGGITLELQKALGLHSDLGPADRYFVYCTTTWVMWNIQVSALLVGSAIVLFDGDPAHPGLSRLWQVIDDLGVTVFGAGGAYLTACRKAGLSPRAEFDMSRLRGMFSTGSPLPADGFAWVYEHVNPDVFLQSTSGGTDVCSSFVGGAPLLPVRAGEIAAPALGVLAQALDPEGKPLIGQMGELVIAKPMPSMPVAFWNDPDGKRYRAAYFEFYPGLWRHGDWVTFDERGACTISGRSDGTLNRGGVRLGSSEFYAVLEGIPETSDSLVVHVDDREGGLGRLILFVELVDGAFLDDELRSVIADALRQQLSPRHVPDLIVEVPEVPYTLTGKKLEVPVKRLLQGAERSEVVSVGSLRNPTALDAFEVLSSRLAEA